MYRMCVPSACRALSAQLYACSAFSVSNSYMYLRRFILFSNAHCTVHSVAFVCDARDVEKVNEEKSVR